MARNKHSAMKARLMKKVKAEQARPGVGHDEDQPDLPAPPDEKELAPQQP